MRTYLFGLILLSLSPIHGWAASCAGGECGGGGNAYVCRNKKGKITGRPQLLDLYEGHKFEKLTYKVACQSVDKELDKAVEKFRQSVGGDNPRNWYMSIPYWYWRDVPQFGTDAVTTYKKNFSEKFVVEDGDAGLPPLDDSGSQVKPKKKGCKIERLAWYLDGKIHIDGEVWGKLDNCNKAALIFHEASYRYERYFRKAEDSLEARKIVRRMFALEPVLPIKRNADSPLCIWSDGQHVEKGNDNAWTEYYILNESGKTYLSFASLLGRRFYSETTLEFDPSKFDDNGSMGKPVHLWREMPPIRIEKNYQDPKKLVLWIQGNENWPEQKMDFDPNACRPTNSGRSVDDVEKEASPRPSAHSQSAE